MTIVPTLLLLIISACGVSSQNYSELEKEVRELKSIVSSMKDKISDLQSEELKQFRTYLSGIKGERGEPGSQGPPGPPHGNSSADWEYVMDQTPLRTCGGFITLQGNSHTVVHQLPKTSTSNETCVWVIWAALGGPINVKLKPDSTMAPYHDKLYLSVFYNENKTLAKGDLLTQNRVETTINKQSVIVFFHGNSTGGQHGVEFQVTDRGTSWSDYQPKMVALDLNSPSYSYKFPPAPQTNYGPNERLFILIRGAFGLHTKIHMGKIDTEGDCDCDYVRGSTLSVTANNIWYYTRYSNTSLDFTTPGKNTPIVFTFRSDDSHHATGFELEYSYVVPQDSQ